MKIEYDKEKKVGTITISNRTVNTYNCTELSMIKVLKFILGKDDVTVMGDNPNDRRAMNLGNFTLIREIADGVTLIGCVPNTIYDHNVEYVEGFHGDSYIDICNLLEQLENMECTENPSDFSYMSCMYRLYDVQDFNRGGIHAKVQKVFNDWLTVHVSIGDSYSYCSVDVSNGRIQLNGDGFTGLDFIRQGNKTMLYNIGEFSYKVTEHGVTATRNYSSTFIDLKVKNGDTLRLEVSVRVTNDEKKKDSAVRFNTNKEECCSALANCIAFVLALSLLGAIDVESVQTLTFLESMVVNS